RVRAVFARAHGRGTRGLAATHRPLQARAGDLAVVHRLRTWPLCVRDGAAGRSTSFLAYPPAGRHGVSGRMLSAARLVRLYGFVVGAGLLLEGGLLLLVDGLRVALPDLPFATG